MESVNNVEDVNLEFGELVEDFYNYIIKRLNVKLSSVKGNLKLIKGENNKIIKIEIKFDFHWWHMFQKIGFIEFELLEGNTIAVGYNFKDNKYSEILIDIVENDCLVYIHKKYLNKFSFGIFRKSMND